MHRTIWLIALMLVVLPIVGWASRPTNSPPVVVSSLLPKAERVLGTDGKYHVVYEFEYTNTAQRPPP